MRVVIWNCNSNLLTSLKMVPHLYHAPGIKFRFLPWLWGPGMSEPHSPLPRLMSFSLGPRFWLQWPLC
jgi:hypothetical protein